MAIGLKSSEMAKKVFLQHDRLYRKNLCRKVLWMPALSKNVVSVVSLNCHSSIWKICSSMSGKYGILNSGLHAGDAFNGNKLCDLFQTFERSSCCMLLFSHFEKVIQIFLMGIHLVKYVRCLLQGKGNDGPTLYSSFPSHSSSQKLRQAKGFDYFAFAYSYESLSWN